MTDFHMPHSWYEPPDEHDCPTPDDCTCEEDALDAYEDSVLRRYEADREDPP